MKLLLDENTTEDFVDLLPSCEVIPLRDLGWTGMKNGVLLDSACEVGFDALITVDKQMRHQQNIRAKTLALIVLDVHPISATNQIACLQQILDLSPGQTYVIEGPHPKRDNS